MTILKKAALSGFSTGAEGEEADQGSEEAEDPERAEFVEYLEYIDSHEPMDFGAYRLMRMRERAAKGIPQPAVPGHHAVVEQRAVRAGGRKRGYRPGTLKKLVRVYRILSVCVTMVLMLTLLLVALSMPRFGDPEAPGDQRGISAISGKRRGRNRRGQCRSRNDTGLPGI